MDNNDIILSWDAVIEDEGSSKAWEPLEAGDYDFEVVNYDRSYGKDGVTPRLDLTLLVDGRVEVKDWLHFKKKAEWKISQFLICIGMKKHGEPSKVDFDNLIGSKGRCRVSVRTFTKNNGEEGKGNNIDAYLEPKPQKTEETGGLKW